MTRSFRARLAAGLLPILVLACAEGGAYPEAGAHEAPAAVQSRIDAAQLHRDVSVLAHDSMEGRAAGTPGNARARAYLLERYRELGLDSLPVGFQLPFTFAIGQDNRPVQGVNLVGVIPGTRYPHRWIAVTAHYDHLGIRDGEIFNGADDNASGTAGLLAVAAYLTEHPPAHSFLILALDAEEMGLRGARAFVGDPPVDRESIVLNVNLDMVGRNDADELYAVGTYHYPALEPLVDRVAAESAVTLLKGHDRPDLPPGDDWTMASDHGPFHQVGIPFLYFGVEDHPDYHQPTDVVESLQPDFHARAVETVLEVLLLLDGEGETLLQAARESREAVGTPGGG